MIRNLGLIVVALSGAMLLFLAAAPRQKTTSDSAESLDAFISALMEEEAVPGLALAVIKNREIIHIEGYGFADVATERPMTADTPMNIASISKPILGIALLQLKDKGLIDLDTDVNAYLPFQIDNPHIDGEHITVRHLATHTSGIVDSSDATDFASRENSPVALADHLRGLLTPEGKLYDAGAHYLKAEPGTAREYSNLGAGVAGAVAEAVGGAPLRDLARDDIFVPLAMSNSSWSLDDFPPTALATRYEVRQCIPFIGVCATSVEPVANYLINAVFNPPERYKRFEPYPQYRSLNYPDGGVYSSARDLATLTLAILDAGQYEGGALLSEGAFNEMLRLQLPTKLSTSQRFFWRDRNNLTGHSGSDRGVFTSLYFDQAKGNAVIVLINRTPDGETEAAMERLIERVSAELLM